jgi:hypothetical protein
VLGEPQVEPALHQLERGPRELLVGDDADLRRQDMAAGHDAADRLAEPADQPVVGEHEGLVDRLADAGRAAFNFGGEGLLRGRVERPRFLSCGLRVRGEAEPVELPDVLAFDRHVAAGGDLSVHDRILS